jgi:hypothetical protein
MLKLSLEMTSEARLNMVLQFIKGRPVKNGRNGVVGETSCRTKCWLRKRRGTYAPSLLNFSELCYDLPLPK